MYCSGCGQALVQGQAACMQCGRPAAAVVPPVPGFQFQLQNYAGKVRALSIVWFIYAALSLITGVAGLTFAHAFFDNHFGGHWSHGPFMNGDGPPDWVLPIIMHGIWLLLTVRTVLALLVGWGLYERAQWGRIIAIIAAIMSLIRFPFGTALGIWTLVTLLGYQNSTLYEQLGWNPQVGANQ